MRDQPGSGWKSVSEPARTVAVRTDVTFPAAFSLMLWAYRPLPSRRTVAPGHDLSFRATVLMSSGRTVPLVRSIRGVGRRVDEEHCSGFVLHDE